MVWLLDLPAEVLAKIINCLKCSHDTQALLALSEVSRFFREELNDASWKAYYERVYFDGFKGSPETMTGFVLEPEKRLKTIELARNPFDADGARVAVIRALAGSCRGCYQPSACLYLHPIDSVYICDQCNNQDQWALIEHTWAKQIYGLSSSDLSSLPSYTCGTTGHATVNNGLGGQVTHYHHYLSLQAVQHLQRQTEQLRDAARAKRRRKLALALQNHGHTLEERDEQDEPRVDSFIQSGKGPITQIVQYLLAVHARRAAEIAAQSGVVGRQSEE